MHLLDQCPALVHCRAAETFFRDFGGAGYKQMEKGDGVN